MYVCVTLTVRLGSYVCMYVRTGCWHDYFKMQGCLDCMYVCRFTRQYVDLDSYFHFYVDRSSLCSQ